MSVQFTSQRVSAPHPAVNKRKPVFAGGNSEPADSFTDTSTRVKQENVASRGKVLRAAFNDAFKPGGFGIFHRPFGGWKRDLAQSLVVAVLTPFTIPMIPFWLATGALYRFAKTLIKGMKNPSAVVKP